MSIQPSIFPRLSHSLRNKSAHILEARDKQQQHTCNYGTTDTTSILSMDSTYIPKRMHEHGVLNHIF